MRLALHVSGSALEIPASRAATPVNLKSGIGTPNAQSGSVLELLPAARLLGCFLTRGVQAVARWSHPY